MTPQLRRVSGAYGAPPLVLVVDDIADTRELYTEYLRFAGFRVEEAENGAAAIEKAIALKPDVVLMDYSMPVMDGAEATRRLRRDPRTRATPVVMLTGYAEAARGRDAPFDVVLEKPCLPEDVSTTIRSVLHLEAR